MLGVKSSFLAVAILAASSSVSHALVQSQTQNYGPGIPNYNATQNFNQFNPALGTLNSIKVSMAVGVSGGTLTVDNDGVGPANVNVALGAKGNLQSIDVSLIDLVFQPVVADVTAQTANIYNLGADNGDGVGVVDGTAPDGAVLSGGAVNNSAFGFINSAVWGPYQGAGTYGIKALIDQILDFGSVGGVEGAFTPVTASASVTVEYDYTPNVPEPGTISLAVLAIVACTAGRGRRR